MDDQERIEEAKEVLASGKSAWEWMAIGAVVLIVFVSIAALLPSFSTSSVQKEELTFDELLKKPGLIRFRIENPEVDITKSEGEIPGFAKVKFSGKMMIGDERWLVLLTSNVAEKNLSRVMEIKEFAIAEDVFGREYSQWESVFIGEEEVKVFVQRPRYAFCM